VGIGVLPREGQETYPRRYLEGNIFRELGERKSSAKTEPRDVYPPQREAEAEERRL